ncbi:MAG: hypothetical protein M3137_08860 [Actinomycetota bacterium]|nr:hypothetical protein [Actinomycetota bacterium]
MPESWWEKIGAQGGAERDAPQAPLASADVWKVRGLYLVYPVAATILVITLGLSAGRVVGATVFFGFWLTMQFLTLSPLRRRQVVGMRPAPDSGSSSGSSWSGNRS